MPRRRRGRQPDPRRDQPSPAAHQGVGGGRGGDGGGRGHVDPSGFSPAPPPTVSFTVAPPPAASFPASPFPTVAPPAVSPAGPPLPALASWDSSEASSSARPPVSDSTSAAALSCEIAKRPGCGTIGKRIVVRANHFLVEVADRDLHHYDVSSCTQILFFFSFFFFNILYIYGDDIFFFLVKFILLYCSSRIYLWIHA
jgi:eukaryotic translation initiation factor 2C